MIDKRIFYCWFGKGEINDFGKSCIESWYEQCPDYEIIRIDESNFDVNINEYCREAYEHGNYAFVSDIARLETLKNRSGFYLDVDIRLFKSLDGLRQYDAIVPCFGKGFYCSAPLGCSTFPEIYRRAYDQVTNGKVVHELINQNAYEMYDVLGRELEVYDNVAFLGPTYFINEGYHKTDKTIGAHYCFQSWVDKWQGDYDMKKNFKAFDIYQDRIRDKRAEKQFFGNGKSIGTLKVYNTPLSKGHVKNGNYFYNEKVMRVIGDDFIMERFKLKPTSRTYEIEGVVIECSE